MTSFKNFAQSLYKSWLPQLPSTITSIGKEKLREEMSRKFKSQASSARAASGAFGSNALAFGSPAAFQTAASSLSYIAELPDLSRLSDPSVVVTFKNLGKKDSTTKGKALEDLQEYLASAAVTESGLEVGFIEAWTNLYPRTAIDNARRVRLLAHSLQGAITSLAGKRIVPHLPKVAGSWLSGTFDADRAVARAAQDALEKSFPAKDKRQALWKIYNHSLLEYAEDAILKQTPQTLSDERTTSPDDAEAKHIRVVGNAVLMFYHLLEVLHSQGLDEDNRLAQTLLRTDKIWQFTFHTDPILRRCIYRLLVLCSSHYASVLPWSELSTSLLSKALHLNQLGSSLQLSEALIAVTAAHSEIWTSDYAAKTAVNRRFLQFLKQGSQRGAESYWTNVDKLVRMVPATVLISNRDATDGKFTLEDCKNLLKALHEGLSSPEEPRQNAATAWRTYARICLWLTEHLYDSTQIDELLTTFLLPVVDQYVIQDPTQSQWSIPAPVSPKITSEMLISIAKRGHIGYFERVWVQETDHMIESVRLSLPETSKDYQKSQSSVAEASKRLSRLQMDVRKLSQADTTLEKATDVILQQSVSRLITAATDVLKTRNGKPFGASCLLEEEIPLVGVHQMTTELDPFLQDAIPSLLSSPSSDKLITVLFLCRGRQVFDSSLKNAITVLMQLEDSQQRSATLEKLFARLRAEDITRIPQVQEVILQSLDLALRGDVSKWPILKAVVDNEQLGRSGDNALIGSTMRETDLQDQVLSRLMEELSVESSQIAALSGAAALISSSRLNSKLSQFCIKDLLPRLVLLSDSSDEHVADQASKLLSRVRGSSATTSSASVTASTIEIIQHQFASTGQLLSIFSLLDLARETLKSAAAAEKIAIAKSILPTPENWKAALLPFLSKPPNQTLAITSPLRGLVHIVDKSYVSPDQLQATDAEGLSIAFRIAIYVVRLVSSTELLESVALEELQTIWEYLPLALQLVNDKITLDEANKMWVETTPEVLEEAADLMSSGKHIISSWLSGSNRKVNDGLASLWSSKISAIEGTSAQSYHLAQTFVSIMSECIDLEGPKSYMAKWHDDIKSVRQSENTLRSGALLAVLNDVISTTPEGRRLCNELVADATELKSAEISTGNIKRIILLNILQNDTGLIGIPTQRMVYLLKALVSILNTRNVQTPPSVLSEVLKLLCSVVPALQGIYGEHWESILSWIEASWKLDDSLVVLHSGLRLFARLQVLTTVEDVNEDLQDAWSNSAVDAGLVNLLKKFGESPNGVNQPRDITTRLLRRELRTVKAVSIETLEGLYPLLNSFETMIQGGAYDLLHRYIPAAQEQISLDVALEGKIARLCPELLALVARTPTTESTDVVPAHDQLWIPTRCYLLSWNLIFDHFGTASYKLQEMYAQSIKDSQHLQILLDFICDQLRIVSGRPIDASRADVDTFNIDTSETLEQEAKELSVLLYFNCLRYLPGLSKEWFIQQHNRIKSPLESWTQKHISPLIVSASLATVVKWAATQDADDRPITIKSSPKGSELIASIAIDEESPPIALSVSLPGAYPLEQAVVTSRSRVAVSEKKWQSWLRTFQVIIFSTGSLIEGLVAFRRNVQGALKGQTECAICYSIIGTDMQTPNKKCGTCKNMFHSVCLFKWFKSSNSSSCPLCRNNFNYA